MSSLRASTLNGGTRGAPRVCRVAGTTYALRPNAYSEMRGDLTGLGGARAKVALRETHEVPPCLRRFDLPCRGLFKLYSPAPPEGQATPAPAPPVPLRQRRRGP